MVNAVYTHPPADPEAAPNAEAEADYADKFEKSADTWAAKVHALDFPKVDGKEFPSTGNFTEADQRSFFRTDLANAESTQLSDAEGMRKAVYGNNREKVTKHKATVGEERKLVSWFLSIMGGDVLEFFADLKPVFLSLDANPTTPLTLFVLNIMFTMIFAQQTNLARASRVWYLGEFEPKDDESFLAAFQRLTITTTTKWLSLPRGRASREAHAAAAATAPPPSNTANAGIQAPAPPGGASGSTPAATPAQTPVSGSAANPVTLSEISDGDLRRIRDALKAADNKAAAPSNAPLPSRRIPAVANRQARASLEAASLLHFSPTNNAAACPGAETVLTTILAFLNELRSVSGLHDTVRSILNVTKAHDPRNDFSKGSQSSVVEAANGEIRDRSASGEVTTGEVITAYNNALLAAVPDNQDDKDRFAQLTAQFERAEKLALSCGSGRKIDRAMRKAQNGHGSRGRSSSGSRSRSRSRSRSPAPRSRSHRSPSPFRRGRSPHRGDRRRKRHRSRSRDRDRDGRRRRHDRSRSSSPHRDSRPRAVPAMVELKDAIHAATNSKNTSLVSRAASRLLRGNCPQCKRPMDRPYRHCRHCNRTRLHESYKTQVKAIKTLEDIK